MQEDVMRNKNTKEYSPQIFENVTKDKKPWCNYQPVTHTRLIIHIIEVLS